MDNQNQLIMKAFKLLPKLTTIILAALALGASAQTPDNVDMAKVQEQLKQAQQMIKEKMGKVSPQLQQMMKKSQFSMDSSAAVFNSQTNIPGSQITNTKITIPDPSKVVQNTMSSLNTNLANLQKMQAGIHQNISKGLPQRGAAAFSAAPPVGRQQVLALANSILPGAIAKLQTLDPQLQKALDAMCKDTTITPQAQGMLMAADGDPKYMVQYMVCRGIQKTPDNPWAINDLGIILRNDGRYKEAAQCFKYAYSFDSRNQIIKSNLGWAVAYYGDFPTAKNYFQQVIDSIPNFQLAWEGLGMIAYQEGNLQMLFSCLSHQLKTVGVGGGSGPSSDFMNFCGGVISDQDMNNAMKGKSQQSDPTADNTFDNNNGEDEANQDPPPTASSDPPNYEVSLGGLFAQNIDQLMDLAKKINTNTELVKSKIKEQAAATAAKQKAITRRLAPPAYKDDQGLTVTPANYEKWYKIFHLVHEDFEKRISWVNKEYDDDWKILLNSIMAQRIAFMENSTKEYMQCHSEEALREFYCKWKPKARGDLGMDLEGISKLFTKYIQKVQEQADWYVSASTPSIKRVHDVAWNEYMNQVREEDIRTAILSYYMRWLPMQTSITDAAKIVLANQPVTCFTQIREIPATGPDPRNVKVKKLKTFPDYCDKSIPATTAEVANFSYYSDCDRTRYGFTVPLPFGVKGGMTAGPASLKYSIGPTLTMVVENVRSKKFKEDDYWNVGAQITIGASASGGISTTKKNSDYGTTTTAGAQGKLGGEVSYEFGTRYDSDFNQIGKYEKGDANIGISENLTGAGTVRGVGTKDFSNGTSIKADANFEAFVGQGAASSFKSSTGVVSK